MNWLFLLRAFLPSWTFFTTMGPEFKLEVRTGSTTDQLSPWMNCIPSIVRSLKTVFINPRGNYLHACHNNLQHLITDTLESEQIENLVSYKITNHMVRFHLIQMNLSNDMGYYQFRVLVYYPNPLNKATEEVLVSPVYRM